MIERLINFALTQRVFVVVLTFALVVFGGLALHELPIEAFPDVQDVQVQVITLYPGQAPEDVERQVSLPIEREMAGIPGLMNLRSVTMNGLSVVTLTFVDGTADYFARQQVTEKLGNVNLPTGVQPGLAPLTTAVGEVYRYALDAPGLPSSEVRALQDWVVRPALRMTSGVADVVSFGGTIKEYQLAVDPQALRRYQVTLDQVNLALGNANASTGGGFLKQGDEAVIIRSAGLYQSLDDIRRVPIAARQGRTVTVGDVGEVSIGERPRYGIVSFDGQDSVVEGIVSMTKGGNPAKINADLRASIAALQPRLPKGVQIKEIYDRTKLVQHTVSTVAENLMVGAALVIGVLMVFLTSWRAAIIVASVIPLALLFAFILMHARGVSANLISLGAVDFGIIIDSAVVIVEALMVRLAVKKLGPSLAERQARMGVLRRTLGDLSHPVLFSKAIIIVAFIPIFTFQRVEGKIFTPVALTLSFALLGAVILTFTWLPTLLAYALRSGTLVEKHKPWLERLQKRYQRLLVGRMRRPLLVLAPAGLLVAVALMLAPQLGTEFLPKLDEGNIWLAVTLPTSASIDTSKEVERRIRATLLKYPEVAHVIAQVGRPDDGSDAKGSNSVELLVDLKPREQWQHADKDSLVEDMSAKLHQIPGIQTNFSQVIQDNVQEAISGYRGEIVVRITGPNLDVLDQKINDVVRVLQGIRGATDVDSTHVGGQTELVITPDRGKLARYGLNIADVNTLINEGLAGAPITAFYEGDRRFDVTARVKYDDRNSPDDIAALQIAIPNSQAGNGPATIALGDVATIEVRQGASRIVHQAGGRAVLAKANLIGRDQGSFVAEAQARVAQAVPLPPGYDISWGGEFENSQRAAKRLMVIVPVTALAIFSLLFWAFRSVRLATIVLCMVPFTMVGGLAALALAGLHLSVSAAVGFIAVAGISVQNGVIMVEEVLARVQAGAVVARAVALGAAVRLRPILMTALMAGLGLLPAALSHGIGSETQRPFACVIVGGIVSGTLFMLLCLPLSLNVFARLARPRVGDAELEE